jgi:hypothetical protein
MLDMIRSSAELLNNQLTAINVDTVNVTLNDDGFVTIHQRVEPQYNADYVPSLKYLLNDATSTKKIIVGPYGSGKTSGCLNKLLADAIEMPMCDDGVRRSKWAIVRNTAGQLETTTLRSLEYWFAGLPTPKRKSKPQLTYQYTFRDDKGPIEFEIVFLALDRIDDIRKLDSFELTGVYFNELRHIPKLIFDTMQSRIKRYPPKLNFIEMFEKLWGHLTGKEKTKKFADWSPYIPKLYADTNPPKNKHWIQVLEDTKPDKNLGVYHQPPALLKSEHGDWYVNEDADNIAFVGNSYYEEMIGRGEEFIKVYAQGKYGTIVDGKPVYANYNDDIHSVEDIGIDSNEPIYMGWDFGLVSPACIIKQVAGGQIRAIKEFCCENETVESLYNSAVKPFLNTYCKGLAIISTHDPANTSEGARQLYECGIESKGNRTNHVEPRLSCVRSCLDKLNKGRPFYVISRKGCPLLREAMIGEYHFRRLKVVGDEKHLDLPNKVHPYSDIADADQYATMRICDDEGIREYDTPYNAKHAYNEDTKSKITGY